MKEKHYSRRVILYFNLEGLFKYRTLIKCSGILE